MGFLAPIGAAVAAAIVLPALVALYFLKLRRRQMVVPSTLLWKKALREMQVNSPFQKLRRNLLLLIQLLLLALLLLAMARPTLWSAAKPGQRMVIVIDHSASMNALDGSPTRLDQAKAAALKLVDQLDGSGTGGGSGGASGGGAMIVSDAAGARVVCPFTQDPVKLRAAIRSIQPTDQPGDLTAALRLIEPYAHSPRLAGVSGGSGGSEGAAGSSKTNGIVVYVLSDGQVGGERGGGPGPGTARLAGAMLRYLPMGRLAGGAGGAGAVGLGVNNVGIVAFSARRQFDQPSQVEVFARLINDAARSVTTTLTLRINGQAAQVRSVTLPAATVKAGGPGPGTARLSGRVTPGSRSVQFSFVMGGAGVVSLAQGHRDLLSADNSAYLVLAPARRLRVLLVTKGDEFLKRAIAAAGVADVVKMTPSQYESVDPRTLRRTRSIAANSGVGTGAAGGGGDGGFDVIVFDHVSPPKMPEVNSLYFAGVPPIPGLAIKPTPKGGIQTQMVLNWERDNPLLRYVTLGDVVLEAPGRLVLPADATVLATGEQGPIMAAMTRHGVRQVVASFDILNTNWPLFVSFPVFISNAIQTLGLGSLADEAGIAYRTGQIAAIPATGSGSVTYRRQAQGDTLTATVHDGRAIFSPLKRVGLYTTADSVGPGYRHVAVNLLDEAESNLAVAPRLRVGTSLVAGQNASHVVRREVWWWFVCAALALLLIEWWIYTRRMG